MTSIKYSNREKADECAREVRYRKHVYDRLVKAGRMTRREANRRIDLMSEIADEYSELAASDEPELFSGSVPPATPASQPR